MSATGGDVTEMLNGLHFSAEMLDWPADVMRDGHDGRIDNDFFDRKAAEFRAEQPCIKNDIATHETAMQAYVDEGASDAPNA